MEIGKMEDFTIDQFAGSMALILGSIGGLLMIIWKSRCKCSMNCCYLFKCSREPPPDEAAGSDDEEEVIPTKKKSVELEYPTENP
tara:strand:- start:166 stop:420 length:255 start_codon:yes stop_codon:yes gene_type:complete